MKYYEDEEFIKKQLFRAEAKNINKLLKRYFEVKSDTKNG